MNRAIRLSGYPAIPQITGYPAIGSLGEPDYPAIGLSSGGQVGAGVPVRSEPPEVGAEGFGAP